MKVMVPKMSWADFEKMQPDMAMRSHDCLDRPSNEDLYSGSPRPVTGFALRNALLVTRRPTR